MDKLCSFKVSTTAMAEIDRMLSCSTKSIGGHFWNKAASSCSCYRRMEKGGCGGPIGWILATKALLDMSLSILAMPTLYMCPNMRVQGHEGSCRFEIHICTIRRHP